MAAGEDSRSSSNSIGEWRSLAFPGEAPLILIHPSIDRFPTRSSFLLSPKSESRISRLSLTYISAKDDRSPFSCVRLRSSARLVHGWATLADRQHTMTVQGVDCKLWG